MLEYEKKLLLSPMEFAVLMGEYPPINKSEQTNYYYDTENLARNQERTTCRIRKKNGKSMATVKRHMPYIEDCSTETSVAVMDENDDAVFTDQGLTRKGQMTTIRYCILYEEGLEAVLDENSYLGCRDYELEIEYSEEKKENAEELLRDIIDILTQQEFQTNPIPLYDRIGAGGSKSERFFKKIKECF